MLPIQASDALAALDALPPWAAVVAVLGVALGAAVALDAVVLRVVRRVVLDTETTLDEILLAELRLPLVVTFSLAGVFVLTRSPAVLASVPLSAAQVELFLGDPVLTVVLVAWAYALNRAVNRIVAEVTDMGPRFQFAPVISNVWTLVVSVGTVGLVLFIWEIDVTPLLAGAGIAGIAVGFAAKDTVANFFGGVALYFDDTYKVGDYIALDSGEKGTVVSVGVRSTTLQTRDEVLVTVPNSVLNAAKVVNESAPGRRKRIRVPLGVAYGTDVDEFERTVLAVAADEALVLDSPKPRMRFRSFGDSALEYELLCWVRSPTRAARARHELNRGVYVALGEAGIEIPYSRVDVAVVGADCPDSGPAAAAGGGAAARDGERAP
jgi:small-conductance mechanosensitive channel